VCEGAITDKEQIVTENLRQNGLTTNDLHILITAYKAEKKSEIYAKKKKETSYTLIATYQFRTLLFREHCSLF